MNPLYEDDGRLTNLGADLEFKVENMLKNLFKEFMEHKANPREISHIIMTSVPYIENRTIIYARREGYFDKPENVLLKNMNDCYRKSYIND